MSIQQSTKKKDAGRIPGPANCPNVIECRWAITIPNSKVTHSVVHGFFTTAPANMQTLANALFTSISGAWSTNLGSFMHPSTTFNNVQVRDMTAFTNPVFVSVGTAVAGTGTGNAMPPDNAIVMTENVAQRGRGAKGRVYLGGWVVGDDTNVGGITTAVQTAINNFGTAVNSALSGQSLQACVAQVARQQYMGYTGTTHPARPAGHVLVTSYVCNDLLWDTQRRRGQL